MKTNLETGMTDELRAEYHLPELKNRVRGKYVHRFAEPAGGALTVTLEPDVAAVFESTAAVNEALRFLIKVAENGSPLREVKASR